jgi:hypothetical protein
MPSMATGWLREPVTLYQSHIFVAYGTLNRLCPAGSFEAVAIRLRRPVLPLRKRSRVRGSRGRGCRGKGRVLVFEVEFDQQPSGAGVGGEQPDDGRNTVFLSRRRSPGRWPGVVHAVRWLFVAWFPRRYGAQATGAKRPSESCIAPAGLASWRRQWVGVRLVIKVTSASTTRAQKPSE